MSIFRRVWPLLALWGPVSAAPGFYSSPTLHGDTVVFTAEGDLWKVPAAGGTAQRLTTHPGRESLAAISPDGKTIAFSAQYEGPTEIYVMPIEGGQPRRLTWNGEGALTVGWTPQGKVLYATKSYSTLPNEQLVAIDPATGDESLLPLDQASEGVMTEDGKRLFFTRLPFQGSRTKRYQGGTAQNLWRYDDGGEEAVPLTANYAGTSKNPMWWQGRLYFLSDRSGVSNVWSMKTDGSDLQAVTKHPDYDIKVAHLDQGRIVYQQGADLHLLTLKDHSDRVIPITLASDFDQTRERWVKRPLDYLTGAHVSPDGDRIVFTARGGVFVAPVEATSRFVTVPHKDGVRYREANFLPDGKTLIAQTDETGEIEMVKLPANGIGQPELLTQDGKIYRYGMVASPDGKHVAWQDKNQELWVRDLDAKVSKKVSTSVHGNFEGLTWSPDSRWLAFSEAAANTFRQIKLYHLTDGKLIAATSDRVISFAPAWSTDGKWLFFLSDRELRSLVNSPWGSRQPEPFFTESTRIYALPLQKGLRSPFEPADELHPHQPESVPRRGEKKDADESPAPPAIDTDHLGEALYEVPGPSGNYTNLVAAPKHLFFLSKTPGFETKPRLMRLDISDKEPRAKIFAEDVREWELSGNHKQVMLRVADAFYVVPADGELPAKLEKAVPLDRWSFSIDPKEEWRQIYVEAWRMMRDFFYDPDLHGVDWPAVKKKYEPLIDRVADRSDLSEVIQEMAGELSALHTFVSYGDLREGTDRIQPSSLGARMIRDIAAGGWRVDHIFRADPDYPRELSPLAKPGVEIREGDVVVSINGTPTLSVPNPQQLLLQQGNQPIVLEMKAAGATDKATRQVVVKPLTLEAARDLRYSEWEYTRRLETEKLGEGKIGYVHLRSMGATSVVEWARQFYPVFDRQGLIIDVRHNTGGSTDSIILEKLLRKAWFYWSARTGNPTWNMQYAFRGHLCVLCNERTASDGEAFSEGIKRLNLGKVIGTRTWGGEIWLDVRRWLVDNGMCSVGETGVFGPEGTWLIEGHGVDPDEVVDNAPHATFQGRDVQLETAVKHLQGLVAKDPREVPEVPKKPDKSVK